MGKGKRPRKRTEPIDEPADREPEIERQTQEQGELVPPVRLPPTAIGAADAPPPPREPPRPRPSPVPERYRPALSDFVQALRRVVGAVLDIADAAAEAITSRIEGRT